MSIDFAICWAYHYSIGSYHVSMLEDHYNSTGRPIYNLPQMAKKLSTIGGSGRGGGGAGYTSSFYWNKDIWDLFKNQYL